MSKPINISASRGAAILGLSKWQTPVSSWLKIMESRKPGFCEKNNYEMPAYEENASMRWGSGFESAIIELAENRQDKDIIEREKYSSASEDEIITCHQDGRYQSSNMLHEGKTTTIYQFRDEWGEPGTDRLPIEYQIQAQHQMICTGAEKVIVSVLVFPRRPDEWEEAGYSIIDNRICYNNKFYQHPRTWACPLAEMGYFHQYVIEANPQLQELMINNYRDFWQNHVLAATPPVPKSYDDIKSMVMAPKGTILASEEIAAYMAEYKQIKSELSGAGPLAKRAEQIKVYVLNWMREMHGITDDDSTDKWILRDNTGRKLASYGKNKKGGYTFR